MRSPIVIALAITLALVAWLASRPLEDLLRGGETAARTSPAAAPAPGAEPEVLVSVRAVESEARPIEPELVINGRTAPARSVRLRAETNGRVVATPVEKGALVEAGAVLIRLDERDRASRVREAEARLAQHELEYEAARRLSERQFQSQTALAQARAQLEATRAQLLEAQLDLERIEIRAPFAGVLEARPVEVGDFVDVGDEVVLLIEQDPYLVVGDAPETMAGRFRVGQAGQAVLADGRVVAGRVRFVASEADPATRTFRIELEVPNTDGRFQAGMSARTVVREPALPAHQVSAATLVLSDTGAIGIKVVDDAGIVQFLEARIARAEADAVWLAGLPERLRIITTGQGFVQPGQKAAVQLESAAPPGEET